MSTSLSEKEEYILSMEKRIEELEQRISVTNEKYDHIFENAPSGVYEIDFIEQKIISCNSELLKYTGYSEDEFYQLNFLDLLSDDSKVRFLERFEVLLSGKEVEEEPHYQVTKKDGTMFWTKLNPTYIYKDGQLTGAHVIVHDISDLKNAEEEIRLTETKFKNLLENAQELIVILQDGQVKVMNNLTMSVGGYSEKMVEGSDFLDFVHPDDREKSVERYLRRIAGEDVEGTVTIRLLTSDGNYRWAEVKSVLIEWEGKPATINFMTDITERVNAEKGLKDTENKYQLVVENTQDAIIVLQDGVFKFMNERTPELLGYEKEEMMSISFLDLVHPNDRERTMERYIASLNGEDVPSNEILRFFHKDGSVRFGEVNNICIDWEGNPATLTFVSDVTDRLKAEKEASIEKSRSEFYLDLLGHDIRNLMQGISAWVEMARENVTAELERLRTK